MRPPDLTGNGGVSANVTSSANGNNEQPNTTGRHTVVFRDGATEEGIKFLRSEGFKVFVSNSSDPNVVREDEVGEANVIVYPALGSATVAAEPDQISRLKNMATSESNNPIEMIRPEKVRSLLSYQGSVRASEAPVVGETISLDYLNYLITNRDAVVELITEFRAGRSKPATAETETVGSFEESRLTWGLQATKVDNSPFSGRGVRVAVLDTGIDFNVDNNGNTRFHPDFDGRTIRMESFVPGVATAKDDHGHGTHCIGTACGPRRPATLPGYGIAFDAEIYAGKVLDSSGRGADGWIIAGIAWAIDQGCRIVSMSLGARKQPGDTFNPAYEKIAQRALAAGTVIVAAAGNDSARPNRVSPVSGPADCPSILAVAALDPKLAVADFSNGEINSNGGEVNIAGPGVNILSSSPPTPPGRKRRDGTSMATPHVAGIAALFAEANPTSTANQLKDLIADAALTLSLGAQDVGSGLVQAPSAGSNVRRVERAEEGIVGVLETSPITIGGGASVGLDFDINHYLPVASGIFTSSQDRLTGCHVVHQSGKQLRNFTPEIDGNHQSEITIECRHIVNNTPTLIRVIGGPSGPLGVNFTAADLPAGVGAQPRQYGANFKVVRVTVTNLLTHTSAVFDQFDGWAGIIKIDN